jgi:hypothetical protein
MLRSARCTLTTMTCREAAGVTVTGKHRWMSSWFIFVWEKGSALMFRGTRHSTQDLSTTSYMSHMLNPTHVGVTTSSGRPPRSAHAACSRTA